MSGCAGSRSRTAAYLICAPVPSDAEQWAKFVPVVAGRLVNAYSQNDWLLAVMCRALSVELEYGSPKAADTARPTCGPRR